MSDTFNPKAIRREHVLQAMEMVDSGKEQLKPSTVFDIVHEGKRYPPKGIMRLAHRLAKGIDVWELSGGKPTNEVIEQLGFTIQTKSTDYASRLNYWKFAPGRQASHWDEFYKEGIMAVAFTENNVGDLRHYKTLKDLENAVGRQDSNEVNSLWICYQANIGDIVFANRGRNTVIGIGVIDGEYEYRGDHPFPHTRKVKWISHKEWSYDSGAFTTDKRERPTLFRADTLSRTEVGPEIVKAYLERYPEFEDDFTINAIWPPIEDASYDFLVSKAATIGNLELIKNYFHFLRNVIQKSGIEGSDERAFFSVPKQGTYISFTYDQRYITYLGQSRQQNEVFLIHQRDYKHRIPQNRIIRTGQFGGRFAQVKPLMDYVIIQVENGNELTDELVEMVSLALKEMMSRTERAYYFRHIHKKSHNHHIYDIATDSSMLDKLLVDVKKSMPGIVKTSREMKQQHVADKRTPSSLNTILYGPPGTGKTYGTISKALKCLGDDAASSDDRGLQRERFDRYVQQGRIVFTTFHQSMSYEDFIEGIKPYSEGGNGSISYEVQEGIFKRISDVAHSNWEANRNSMRGVLTFEQAFQRFEEEWEENPNLKIPTKKKDYTITHIGNRSISFRKASGGTSHTLSINTIRELFYGTRENSIGGLGVYYPGLVEKIKSYTGDIKETPLQNYVLIIDEINRGNVSQIFGELITLLEPDKRLGMNEQLRVTLPYSGEEFGVPPNLYIIGTMNTADRSVEALDTALRRRFSFEEMPPRYDLQELDRTEYGVQVSDLLQTINARIEKLLDRDHLIGHSYFMDRSISLKEVFQNKIIPLLQEYFFGDYGKIGLVLGRGFVEVHENKSSKVTFASFDYDEAQDLADRRVYRILWPDTMNNAEFQSALQLLMNKR